MVETEDSAAAEPRRKLFGRRRGKRLRASQERLLAELLPALQVPGVTRLDNPDRLPLAPLFPDGRPVWLEIGFGGGEHMVAQAAANPEVGILGCEPFVNGVAMALGAIERAGVSNLRLHPGDARDLVDLLPERSLSRIFLLYPDPWPKTRHAGRRFANRENLALLAPSARPGAELRIATDIAAYADHALAEAAASPGWRVAGASAAPWDGWPGTRYEAKALKAGRQPRYLTLLRDA